FAFLTLLCAFLVVANPFSRNPVTSAMFLVLTIVSMAGLFVLLHAFFIAAIQVLVYAGAVMVLFLFVIMLLNLGHASSDMRGPSALAAAVVIVGLLSIELVTLWRYTPARLAQEISQAPAGLTDPSAIFM